VIFFRFYNFLVPLQFQKDLYIYHNKLLSIWLKIYCKQYKAAFINKSTWFLFLWNQYKLTVKNLHREIYQYTIPILGNGTELNFNKKTIDYLSKALKTGTFIDTSN